MLYFVRHGETYWNALNRTQGWRNNPLNAKGKEQANNIANILKKYEIEHFYSSDLMRTRQTSKIINEELGLKITFDKRLREGTSGDLDGAYKKRLPKEVLDAFYADVHKFNAEDYEDIFNRAKNFIAELKARKLDNVLIVTHGGFIKTIKYLYEKETFNKEDFMSRFSKKEIENTEILEFDFYK